MGYKANITMHSIKMFGLSSIRLAESTVTRNMNLTDIDIKLVLPDGAPVSAIVPLLSQFRREGGVLLGSHAKLVTEFEEEFESKARAATIIQRAIRKYRGAQQEGKPDLEDELAESEQKFFRCRIQEGELRIHQHFLMVEPGSVDIGADVLLYVFPHPDPFQRFQEGLRMRQYQLGLQEHSFRSNSLTIKWVMVISTR